MRLFHPALSTPIPFAENTHPILVVENVSLYRSMIEDLLRQSLGEEGEFVLSKDFVPLDCQKHLHVLLDFFHLSASDKKLQTKFTAEMKTIVGQFPLESAQLKEAIYAYLSLIAQECPHSVEYAPDIDPMAILKASGFQLHLETQSLLDRILSYLTICGDFFSVPCFVLVGAGSFLEKEELAQLKEMAKYKKWNLLRIEHHQTASEPDEYHRIVDSDLCEICLDRGDEIY